MKGIIIIHMTTSPDYGGGPSTWMFKKQIEIVPSLRDWITLIDSNLMYVEHIGNIMLSHLKQVSNDSFSAIANLCIPVSKNNVEYYRSLIQNGWMANIEEVKRIQEHGYHNFKPELF